MTPERVEQERAKFEKNIPESGIANYKRRLRNGDYAYDLIKFAWEMWLARAAQSEWISVEDRLPKEVRFYLTCNADGVVRFSQFNGKNFSYWEYDEEDGEDIEVIYFPNYWQPLPDPPTTNPAV